MKPDWRAIFEQLEVTPNQLVSALASMDKHETGTLDYQNWKIAVSSLGIRESQANLIFNEFKQIFATETGFCSQIDYIRLIKEIFEQSDSMKENRDENQKEFEQSHSIKQSLKSDKSVSVVSNRDSKKLTSTMTQES